MVGFSGRKHAKSFIFFQGSQNSKAVERDSFSENTACEKGCFRRNSEQCTLFRLLSSILCSSIGPTPTPSHPWGSVSPVKRVVMNVEDTLKKVVTFKTEQLDKSLRPHPLTLQVNAEVEICIYIYNILSKATKVLHGPILCCALRNVLQQKKKANHVGLSYFIFTQTNREHCHNLSR